MENKYSIYKFTFSDGKTYIGQTKNSVEERWKNGEGYKGQEVYIPIVLEGWDNIKKEILHTNLSAEQADKLEKYYIKKFNSITNGYNRASGGSGHRISQAQKELELQQIEKKKVQLEQELSQKIPTFGDKNNPNRILTFSEIYEYAQCYPEMEVIIQKQETEPYISTCKKQSHPFDVDDGGIGRYTYSFLAQWRVWIGNPDIKTMISIPWLEPQEVFDYNKLFVRDEKVKKFIEKYNEFPATFMPSFHNYYD